MSFATTMTGEVKAGELDYIKSCARILIGKYGRESIHIAAFHNHASVMECLNEQGVSYDCHINGKTPLFYAAAGNAYDAMLLLYDRGAELDVVLDDHNQTAMHMAAAGNAVDAMDLLLERSNGIAMLDVCNNDGLTPMGVARKWKAEGSLDWLKDFEKTGNDIPVPE